MKKFTKLMLSAAAITTVSAAMAVSAMAADTITGTYAKDTGIVTLDGVVSSGDQQTLLVLTEDAPTVTEGIIAQIDQDASISSFVLTSGLESGTYYIRIGGTNGTIQTGTLTISSGSDVETVTIVIGDANLDGSILANDASAVAAKAAGTTTRQNGNVGNPRTVVSTEVAALSAGSSVVIGDANLDGSILANDASAIAAKAAGTTTRQNGNVGLSVEVVAE